MLNSDFCFSKINNLIFVSKDHCRSILESVCSSTMEYGNRVTVICSVVDYNIAFLEVTTCQLSVLDFGVSNFFKVEEVSIDSATRIVKLSRCNRRLWNVIKDNIRISNTNQTLKQQTVESRSWVDDQLVNSVASSRINIRRDECNLTSNLRGCWVDILIQSQIKDTSFKLCSTWGLTDHNSVSNITSIVNVSFFDDSSITFKVSDRLTKLEDSIAIQLSNALDKCREESATSNFFIQVECATNQVDNVNMGCARVDNSSNNVTICTLDLLTQCWEDTEVWWTCLTRIQLNSVNWRRSDIYRSIVNSRCRFGRLSKYNVATNNLIRNARCLNHTVDGNHQLILLDDNLLTFNRNWERFVNTVESRRNVIQFLHNRGQDFLRGSQTLFTEEDFSIVVIGVNWLCCTERCDLVNVGVVIDVNFLRKLSTDLSAWNILTANQLQLSKHVETSRVVVFKDLSLPFSNRNLRLDNVREVLVEEGILDFLDDFGWFTNIIDKLTRSPRQRSDIKHTTGNAQVIDDTRRFRDRSSDFFANFPIPIVIDDFKDLRTDLPTSISRNLTSCTCKLNCTTLEDFFAFKEARCLNNCFCFTTEDFGEQYLTTTTLSQECDVITCLCCLQSQCKADLVGFQWICLTSDCIVDLTSNQRGQTCARWFGKDTFSTTDIFSTELDFCTSCDAVREVKLQIVEVKVNNVVKLRLQRNWRLRWVSSTRILDNDLTKSVILNNGNCISTFAATTFNNNCRSRCITSTRINNLNFGKNRSIEELEVNREGNFWFQGVIVWITETKFVILQSLDLTDVFTSQEDRCTATFARNDDIYSTTRSRQGGTKNARNSVNINACSVITLTWVSNIDFSDCTRSSFFIWKDCNGYFTAFTVSNDRHVIIDARCIFCAAINDDNLLNLTEGCNIGDDRQFLVESTRRNKFDRVNRTNCSLRSRRVEWILLTLIICANLSVITLRLSIKWEFEFSITYNLANSESTLIWSSDNVNIGTFANWRVISSPRRIEVVRNVCNITQDQEFNKWWWCTSTLNTRGALSNSIVEGILQFILVILREGQIITEVRRIAKLEVVLVISSKQKSRMLSVNVYILNAIIDKGRIRDCCWSNTQCKLSRSNNIVNEERSVELITLESFSKENIVCFIVVRSIRCEIHLISPNTTRHDDVFLKTCHHTNFLNRCKTRDLYRLLIFCQSDIVGINTDNVIRNEVRSRMDF